LLLNREQHPFVAISTLCSPRPSTEHTNDLQHGHLGLLCPSQAHCSSLDGISLHSNETTYATETPKLSNGGCRKTGTRVERLHHICILPQVDTRDYHRINAVAAAAVISFGHSPSDASGTCGSPPSAFPTSTGYFFAAISKSRVISHKSASFRSPQTNGPHLLFLKIWWRCRGLVCIHV